MRKPILALTIVLALIVWMGASVNFIDVATANFLPAPAVMITSPLPVTIYPNSSVRLDVGVNVLLGDPEVDYIRYSIDGKANVTLTDLLKTGQVYFAPNRPGVTFHVHEILNDLDDGKHMLWVYSHNANGKEMSSSVEFTVDTHYKPPELLILSPQNQTYAATELPLTFTVKEQVASSHYMLDNSVGNQFNLANTPITGNTTLTGLSNGMHKITVTVWTQRGPLSQTVYFSIDNQASAQTGDSSNLENLALPIAIAVVAISLLVVLSLLLYRRKKSKVESKGTLNVNQSKS